MKNRYRRQGRESVVHETVGEFWVGLKQGGRDNRRKRKRPQAIAEAARKKMIEEGKNRENQREKRGQKGGREKSIVLTI